MKVETGPIKKTQTEGKLEIKSLVIQDKTQRQDSLTQQKR